MPKHPETQYTDIISHLVESGDRRIDRTGVGTASMFGAMMRFDLSDGQFPVFTTKRVYWKTAVKEMLWFLKGDTNIQTLLKSNVKIWTDWPLAHYRKVTGDDISQEDFETRVLSDDEFAAQWGDLGPVYGKQWRRWVDASGKEHDQITTLIQTLRQNPTSRRMLFHAWNVGELDQMALPPCHMVYQFYTAEGKARDAEAGRKLSMLCLQRSCDVGLGLPFNACQQAALLRMVAQQVDMTPGELIWMGGDVHLYLNHLDMAGEILKREPKPWPTLTLKRRPPTLFDYSIDDFQVDGYDPHPAIDAPVAV